jgi:hypothetical protein
MKYLIFLIITRILDITTTLIDVNEFGIEMEGNPIIRKTLESNVFILYQIFMLGIIILIAGMFKKKYRKIIYIIISILGLLASASNLYCYLFIR